MIAAGNKLSELAVFISHGVNDNALPVNYARAAMSYLKAAGIEPVYEEYTAGHTISIKILDDLKRWLQ